MGPPLTDPLPGTTARIRAAVLVATGPQMSRSRKGGLGQRQMHSPGLAAVRQQDALIRLIDACGLGAMHNNRLLIAVTAVPVSQLFQR